MFAMLAAVLLAAPAAEPVNIVLVHGAFADGAAWNKVIPKLEAKGLRAFAVQLPETSLQEDVAAVKRMIATVKGPVVLVGHSYGGVVITVASEGEPTVKSLVYVAALAPDQDESANDLLGKFPPVAGDAHIQPQTGDYLWLDPAAFRESFCQDVPAPEAKLLADAQKPIHKSAFGEKPKVPGSWHTLPSWFVLTTKDRMVSPELQKYEAKRMHSTVVEVATGHAPFLVQPAAVAKAIIAAASAKAKE